MHARKPNQRQHQNAIAEIADEVAEPEADREQPPEQSIAQAPGVAAVERAADREGREHRARQAVEPVEVDHCRALPSLRSNSIRRVVWMMKAAIAVGIAHTDNCSGVSSIP